MKYGSLACTLLLLAALVCAQHALLAQSGTARKSREELERERHRLEEDVKLTRKLILQTKSGQKKSLAEVKLLENQIRLGERLQNTMQTEVKELDAEIETLSTLTVAMQADIKKLQQGYGRVAYLTYKRQNNTSALLWLLSAETFEQAYYRLKYFREFSRFRKSQIFLVKRTKDYFTQKTAELEQKRGTKQTLVTKRKNEAQQLVRTKAEKNQVLLSLQDRENTYRKQLTAYKTDLEAVQNEIERIIREEIERARAEVAKANKAGETNKAKFEAAERDKNASIKLSGLFEKNRGKLPWPVPQNKGVVTGFFGRTEDASGGEINNDGIYISTEKDAPVRAIFSGKVTHVRTNKVVGTVVIVQHGRFRSVYVNFKDVNVKEGQLLSTLDEIGTVSTNTRTGATELHFLIYNDRTPVDPLQWIARKN
jgi:septal ring factor EnvC (AmiA/AmiB activator)